MSQDRLTNIKHAMAVIAVVEEWESLKSLLQNSSGDKCFQSTFSSQGSKQVCDLAMDSLSISLHYKAFKEDMPDEAIGQIIDGCFKSCQGGVGAFLLLIQGGYYTKKERRMVEILQSHFGAEALRFLVILSVEDGKVTDTLDDALLDLINVCDGRYCRITSSTANGGLHALVEMVNNVRSENSEAGYTQAMLEKSKRRCVEDSAMNMLKQKEREAEEKEQVFMEKVRREEERRAKEVEDLNRRHAEERRKEAEEKKQHETDRENIQEAMMSHSSMLQLQARAPDGDKTKKMSVILLGLTGSGKSSALHLILNRGANLYSLISSCYDQTQPTLSCEKKEIFTGGKRLALVDTPELWDEDGVENTEMVKDCLALALPGPHVFLLVLQVGRFTQGESEMLGHVQRIFGREVAEHAIVLFVHFDSNQPRPFRINDHVARAHPALQDLVRKCGSRFYELNVTKSQSALSYSQVRELLSGIDKLVASHGHRAYTVKRFSLQELQQRNNAVSKRMYFAKPQWKHFSLRVINDRISMLATRRRQEVMGDHGPACSSFTYQVNRRIQ
ncbi:GTPase IMAP family member 8-like [Poeciliopsis prolifica]|uniref:GTPase IMAP family member 8-like n=1 Tax=Poeciliopsis prolifica TaxID=188132 RepID=UPI00241462B5|nr:GTPase IMAP family member 8-like [Poeciliopsis prolifica]